MHRSSCMFDIHLNNQKNYHFINQYIFLLIDWLGLNLNFNMNDKTVASRFNIFIQQTGPQVLEYISSSVVTEDSIIKMVVG